MKKISYGLVVVLCFLVYSCSGHSNTKTEEHSDNEFLLKPACNQYCDDISSIAIFYTAIIKTNRFEHLKYLERRVSEVVREKEYSQKIDVISVERPVEKEWVAFSPTRVRIGFDINKDGIKEGLVQGEISMVTPSGSYNNSFLCPRSKNKSVSDCLNKEIDLFIDKMIEEFLFNKSILNDTRIGG